MRIICKNFLGVKRVEVPLPEGPVAVIGPNSSGKTSLATAIAGLLSRNHNPLGMGMIKNPYMKDGEDYGEVLLRSDSGTEYARWVLSEKGVRVFAEAPEPYGTHSLALVNFIDGKPAVRTDIWETIFLPPAKELSERISEELRQKIVREAVVVDVIDYLRMNNWVDTEAVYKGKAKESKRQWEVLTGEHYGPAKAKAWAPSHWRSNFEGVTTLEAESFLESARESLRMVQVQQAVSESDKERAEQASASIPALEATLKQAEADLYESKSLSQAQEDVIKQSSSDGREIRSRYDAHIAARPKAERAVPCPDCGALLIIGSDHTLARSTSQAEMSAQMKAWELGKEVMDVDLSKLRQEVRRLREDNAPAEALYQSRKELRNKCSLDLAMARGEAKKGNGHVATAEDEARVALAEQQIESARAMVDSVRRKAQAVEAHNSVMDFTLIAKALGPSGIRGQAISESMSKFRGAVDEVTRITDWPEVTLDSSYMVMINGRPAPVSSGSEKWRAQFTIQCALAIVTGDKRVVADGADILGPENRTQLIALCEYLSQQKGVYAIICATGPFDVIPPEWKKVSIQIGGVS